MNPSRNLVLDIVESEEFQEQITGPMIEDFMQRLNRPGADGKTYRNFILDWLYFERPMLARYKSAQFNVQLEGPSVALEGTEYPLGGFVERGLQWARIGPVDARELALLLNAAIDRTVLDWMADRDLSFVPANPEPRFADREAADAEAVQSIRDFLGSTGKPMGYD